VLVLGRGGGGWRGKHRDGSEQGNMFAFREQAVNRYGHRDHCV
jgi:hypothetical protein